MFENFSKKVLKKDEPCVVCAAKDKEIRYLRKLIDNLLLKNGVRAVDGELKVDDQIEQELIPEGVERYGS